MAEKQEIFITMVGNITEPDKRKLAEAGVLVIEAKNPKEVIRISEAMTLPETDLVMSLLKGVVNYTSLEKPEVVFAKELEQRLKEKNK